MLDFMWHLRGSVPLEEAGPNEVALDRVGSLLERQLKAVSERGADYLTFDDPLWSKPFSPNWPAMVIYDQGRFWIERRLGERRLHYDLRSLHGMVFCLFGALMAFFFTLARGFWGGLEYAVGVFAWLYGMNVLIALARVPSAIRKAVMAA